MIEGPPAEAAKRARAAAARRGESAVILVVAEHRQGALNRATWETVAAAQLLSERLGALPLKIVIPGRRWRRRSGACGGRCRRRRHHRRSGARTLHPGRLRDGVGWALSRRCRPGSSLCRTRTRHAISCRRLPPVSTSRSSPTSQRVAGTADAPTFLRPMFQGKLAAEVRPAGGDPCFVTFQIGAFRADQVRKGSSPSAVSALAVTIDRAAIRQVPEAPFQEAQRAVDLSQAARIVAVGRGIKSKEQLPVAEALAAALGAELAASRPICDSGWLPMERQVGSSGQTVAPKLYVATRDFRRDPASRRHEGIADDRGHQQGSATHPSSRWPTTASSAICSRSCPPSSRSSRGNDETTNATKLTNLTIELGTFVIFVPSWLIGYGA